MGKRKKARSSKVSVLRKVKPCKGRGMIEHKDDRSRAGRVGKAKSLS